MMTILTVGFACLDLVCVSSASLEQSGLNSSANIVRSGGGACANAAYLLALWGEKIYHISHLNNDNYANQIVSELTDAGVNTGQFIFSEKMVTPLEVITIDEKAGTHSVISHRLTTPPKLTMAEKNKLNHFMQTMNGHKHDIVILIDGYEAELSEYLIEHLPKIKVIMCIDNLSDSSLYLAQHADYLIVTEKFAGAFLKLKNFRHREEIKNALKRLRSLTNGKVIIRLDKKGCAYLDRQQVVIIPAFENQSSDYLIDVAIFQGAFAYGISYGWSLEKTILFANLSLAATNQQKRGRNAMPNLVDINRVGKSFSNKFTQYF